MILHDLLLFNINAIKVIKLVLGCYFTYWFGFKNVEIYGANFTRNDFDLFEIYLILLTIFNYLNNKTN